MISFEITVPFGGVLNYDKIKVEAAKKLRLRGKRARIVVFSPSLEFDKVILASEDNVSENGSWSVSDFLRDADYVCEVAKKSLDARGKIVDRYRIEVYDLSKETWAPYKLPIYKNVAESVPVIVVGAGPAGMFAALKLLELGLKPIVLERGKDVRKRSSDVSKLSARGILDPESNYCFGEGGAGAFSDGKLYTRSSKRGDNREVLYQLVRFGASPSILIESHPHIGSNKLPKIVENIRHCVEEYGGEYHFDSRVYDIMQDEEGEFIVSVEKILPTSALPTSADCVEEKQSKTKETYKARSVILATGHSARDIYEIFYQKGWSLEQKGFALGVRVEHPQDLINNIRYKGQFRRGMPAAEYSFVRQVDGRGVFSFCMCPGGVLVPSSTEDETVVLNGMSNSARNSKWANAGVVVAINPEDIPKKYENDGPFAAMNFQRDVERKMFKVAEQIVLEDETHLEMQQEKNPNHHFIAPAQRMKDFCEGRVSADLPITSYKQGIVSAPLHEILPISIASRLRKAFPEVDKHSMRGYYTNDALILGVESRTSSPIRMPRDRETFQCPEVPGLYPCGEGAGYSGGIVSSAIDGINCAKAAKTYTI